MLRRMYRELAQRRQNGIVVRLLWDVVRDRVVIRYRDDATGDAFTCEVPRGRALQAFHHPNAFRADASPAFA
jgi:hypothetical protein